MAAQRASAVALESFRLESRDLMRPHTFSMGFMSAPFGGHCKVGTAKFERGGDSVCHMHGAPVLLEQVQPVRERPIQHVRHQGILDQAGVVGRREAPVDADERAEATPANGAPHRHRTTTAGQHAFHVAWAVSANVVVAIDVQKFYKNISFGIIKTKKKMF